MHIVHTVFPSPQHRLCDMSGQPDVSYFLHWFLCANHHETPPVNILHGSPLPCGVVFLCLTVLTVSLLSLLLRQADGLSDQHPSVTVTLNATFSLNIQLKILCSISASLHSASSQDVWVISHLCYLPSSYELKHFFIG